MSETFETTVIDDNFYISTVTTDRLYYPLSGPEDASPKKKIDIDSVNDLPDLSDSFRESSSVEGFRNETRAPPSIMTKNTFQKAIDLEDAVGMSLALAINNLDINIYSSATKEEQTLSEDTERQRSLSSSSAHIWESKFSSNVSQLSGVFPDPQYENIGDSSNTGSPAIQINQDQSLQVGQELFPFFTDFESHALILWNIPALSSYYLRIVCEAQGEMYYLNDDFLHSFGVLLFAYMDIRVAVKAHASLSYELRQMGVLNFKLNFAILLNSYNPFVPSAVQFRNIPMSITDFEVAQDCRVKGGEVSCVYTDGCTKSERNVYVEFFDIRAAKSALSQFKSYMPKSWGPFATAEASLRSESEYTLGNQLLSIIERWRAISRNSSSPMHLQRFNSFNEVRHSFCNDSDGSIVHGSFYRYRRGCSDVSGMTTPETTPGSTPPSILDFCSREDSCIMSGDFKVPQHVCSHDANHFCFNSPLINQCFVDRSCLATCNTNQYSVKPAQCMTNQLHDCRTKVDHAAAALKPSVEYALDLAKIARGLDKRTTIMIRNIPNKYTQAMLLREIDINYYEAYDFFYLPIDFKNKCNVGYAFMNFIDYKSIVQFTREFNGQRWRNFNSEKVCAITYARIQGKASMINRFQNSSLMEKDDEYRPLIFYSVGPDRGRPEQFPQGRRLKKLTSPR